jgi:hypothetical protein
MLHLDNHPAVCLHYSNRAENHGGEPVPAGDLSLQFDLPSAALEHFDSGLRDAMFRKPLSGEQQDMLGDGYTAVRFPRLAPWVLDEEFPGYEIAIGGCMNLTEPLRLVDVNLKGFVFEPLEGGSVRVKCKAQVHPGDAEEAGALCFAVKNAIALTLVPPTRVEPEQTAPDSDPADAPMDGLMQAAQALEKAA